ncbi:iron-siderophore ABC transporter substrate-binding protein [Planococcus sp. CP5-4]|uniref:ABC transporter substrate-binding protein n=1 Tax=unclassified Planococcus (in: firmicutes) TaxID=2662419 RepID=UPI001C212FE8|nr:MULTISPECIES: iron-siderophore ABC transporter substrate-binding protein [unclassified Planococcus (in: firmicutes)]MBU9671810.1 iron-siderophore ABC transporter substrate-binding protein [Planococcus sp. CP5-4_YE]MBV0909130.1 iron-siderophore ABC transporter substrate-binding protein [Planococcus sp. CP5-4_UN]MBW6063622.1 iron-siderophore ABC transporter substrate-binding protein [Planococcus sp. CP5-4]
MSKKFYSTTILLMALVLLLAACGSEEPETQTENNGDTANAESYTVEHAMGSTEITSEPERIVVLTNHGTEALLSMGVTPVGAVQSWTGDPWYEHISEDMEGVEVVGTESELNLEAIAALEPDLIIGNKMRQEEQYQALNAIAPTVFEETLRGDWKINFELIAETINKEEQGQEVLDDYNTRVAELSENLGDKLDTEVSMVRFMPDDVRIYHKDSFSGIILQEIGLARPESQDVDDFAAMGVTKERIEEMDGDVIFYFTYMNDQEEGQQAEDAWVEDPIWNNLEAVQAGNAYEVSDTIWNTAGGVKAANLMLDDLEEKLLQ